MARGKSALTDPDTPAELARLNAYFDELPVSPRRAATLRGRIDGLRDALLRAARERGYSVRELADHLRAQGIEIPAATLRQYLGPIRKKSESVVDPLSDSESSLRESVEPSAVQPNSVCPVSGDRPLPAPANPQRTPPDAPPEAALGTAGPAAAPGREATVDHSTAPSATSPEKPPLQLASAFTPKSEVSWDEFTRGAGNAEAGGYETGIGTVRRAARRD